MEDQINIAPNTITIYINSISHDGNKYGTKMDYERKVRIVGLTITVIPID